MFEAGRIGWIKQFSLARRALQLTRNHSGLNDRNCIGKTYFLDSIHPHERENNPSPNWDATSDIAVPGPAGGYGNFILVSKLQQDFNVSPRSGEDDDFRCFVSEPFVAAMVGQRFWIVSYNIVTQQLAQLKGNVHLAI
jgi:hypothetical protein